VPAGCAFNAASAAAKNCPVIILRRALDNALADLDRRPADLDSARVLHHRLIAVAVLGREVEDAGAAHETPLTFAVHNHLVMFGRTDFVELELAGVNPFDRRDTDVDGAGEFVGASCSSFSPPGIRRERRCGSLKRSHTCWRAAGSNCS
jgi:hypothetical protein